MLLCFVPEFSRTLLLFKMRLTCSWFLSVLSPTKGYWRRKREQRERERKSHCCSQQGCCPFSRSHMPVFAAPAPGSSSSSPWYFSCLVSTPCHGFLTSRWSPPPLCLPLHYSVSSSPRSWMIPGLSDLQWIWLTPSGWNALPDFGNSSLVFFVSFPSSSWPG